MGRWRVLEPGAGHPGAGGKGGQRRVFSDGLPTELPPGRCPAGRGGAGTAAWAEGRLREPRDPPGLPVKLLLGVFLSAAEVTPDTSQRSVLRSGFYSRFN